MKELKEKEDEEDEEKRIEDIVQERLEEEMTKYRSGDIEDQVEDITNQLKARESQIVDMRMQNEQKYQDLQTELRNAKDEMEAMRQEIQEKETSWQEEKEKMIKNWEEEQQNSRQALNRRRLTRREQSTRELAQIAVTESSELEIAQIAQDKLKSQLARAEAHTAELEDEVRVLRKRLVRMEENEKELQNRFLQAAKEAESGINIDQLQNRLRAISGDFQEEQDSESVQKKEESSNKVLKHISIQQTIIILY